MIFTIETLKKKVIGMVTKVKIKKNKTKKAAPKVNAVAKPKAKPRSKPKAKPKAKPRTKPRAKPRSKKVVKKVSNPAKTLKNNEFEIIVEPEKSFYFHDGKVARSLKEMVDILGNADDDVFYYHVNDERNDFYNWIKDVFNESDLAEKILPAKNPKDFQIIILKEMVSKKKK